MGVTKLVVRQALRRARASRTRSLFIVLAVAGGSAWCVVDQRATAAYFAMIAPLLIVAKRSPRPLQAESDRVWQRFGASHSLYWIGVCESIMLGASATLVATGMTHSIQFAVGNSDNAHALRFAFQSLLLITAISLLPTQRFADAIAGNRVRRIRKRVRGVGFVIQLLVTTIALIFVFSIATSIDSNFNLFLSALFGFPLLILASTIATRPLIAGFLWMANHTAELKPMHFIASRNSRSASLRLVISIGVAIAAVSSFLGASIEQRTTISPHWQAVQAIPEMPRNVMLIDAKVRTSNVFDDTKTQNPEKWAAFFNAHQYPEFPADARDAIARALPGINVIPLNEVHTAPLFVPNDGNAFDLTLQGREPCQAVVIDAAIMSILKTANAAPTQPCEVSIPRSNTTTLVAAKDLVATNQRLLQDVIAHRALPEGRFTSLDYVGITRADVDRLHLRTTTVGAFLIATRPLQRADVATVRRILAKHTTRYVSLASFSSFGPSNTKAEGSDSCFVFCTAEEEAAATTATRTAPFAATLPAQRWLVVGSAGLMALLVLLGTLAINTIDRRDETLRFERLGATPGQIRGAAALHAAILVGSITIFNITLAATLVRVGTAAFNKKFPEIPIPFVVPWTSVLLLVVVLPAASAALAAALARPASISWRAPESWAPRHTRVTDAPSGV